jgi:hypothetical protein
MSGIKKPSKGKPRDSGLEQIELAVNGRNIAPGEGCIGHGSGGFV